MRFCCQQGFRLWSVQSSVDIFQTIVSKKQIPIVGFPLPAAKLQEYAKSTNSSQCRVEGCAWTHGFRGLFRIRMIIAAYILGFTLSADQLSGDLRLIICKYLR